MFSAYTATVFRYIIVYILLYSLMRINGFNKMHDKYMGMNVTKQLFHRFS